MILPIKNKENFIQNFLNPVSRLNSSATLDIHDTISTIVHNNSNIFLKAEYKIDWDDHPEEGTLCLPDTIKLIKILSCLDESDIHLKIEENCIKYSSNINRFTYHLFDDSLSNNNPFDFNKIDDITFDTKFKLTKEKNNTILKALPFVTESSKIYIKTENTNVYAELSDKKLQNVDSYTTLLADKYNGKDLDYELILDVELFRLISTLNFNEATININNQYKMLMLKLNIDNIELTFVSTSYKN
tara:strand:- start:1571 stop:2302 length:732 start_codon:yes stop_codon:yes gene_type:complete